MNIEYYESLVTSKYGFYTDPDEHGQNVKTKLMRLLDAVVDPLTGVMATAESMMLAFDPENASGPQLDVIGELVGVKRLLPFIPTGSSREMTDDEYRVMIQLRIEKNNWDGTNEGAVEIYEKIFPGQVSLEYEDCADMSINVYLHMATTRQAAILEGTNNLLIPAGIQCNVQMIVEDSTATIYPATAVSGVGVKQNSEQE